MPRHWMMTAVIFMIVNAVLFGIGATTVLSVPSLSAEASTLVWVVAALSFVLALPIAYILAPRLRARSQRLEEARRGAPENDDVRPTPRTSAMPH